MPGFFSNVFKLTTGTMIAQVVGILLIPVVTRVYSPEFLGVSQLFLSIATVIVVISSFSYHFAVMLPEKNEDSMTVFVLCILCILCTSTVAGAVVVGFADKIGEIFATAAIADYLIWVPVYVSLSGLSLILTEWLSRKVKYGILSREIVTSSISTRVFQIGGTDRRLPPGPHPWFGGGSDPFAVRYNEFPLYENTASLANGMSWELPAFMLSFFFSPIILGYYALAMMVVRMPMTMVGTAASQVFYQRASEEKSLTGGVQTVVQEIHTRLIAAGIFPFILLIILAEELFTFIFGTDWLTADTYARILASWLFAVFVVSPITTLFGVLERQRVFLLVEAMILCAWVVAFYVGGTSGNPLLTLTLFSIGGMLMWGAKRAYLIRESGAGYRGAFSA